MKIAFAFERDLPDSIAEGLAGVVGTIPAAEFLDGPLADLPGNQRLAGHDLLIVLDAGSSSTNALAQLIDFWPGLDVIVLREDPSTEFLVDAMRAGIREVVPAFRADLLEDALKRASARRASMRPVAPAVKCRAIGFMSAKGGDGSTVLAANYAAALAKARDSRILLIDLGLPFGDCDMLLCASPPEHDVTDYCRQVDRLDPALHEAMIHPVCRGLDLIAAPSSLERMLDVDSAQFATLLERLRPLYSAIVIDLGSSLNHVNVPALQLCDDLMLVATPGFQSLRRLQRTLAAVTELGDDAPAVQIVVNRVRKHAPLTTDEIETTLGHSAAVELPDCPAEMEDSVLKSSPVVLEYPKAGFSRQLVAWSGVHEANTKRTSLWRRLTNG